MAKNKKRKGAKKLNQVVPIAATILIDYQGKKMRVKNPKYKPGKTKTIKHDPK